MEERQRVAIIRDLQERAEAQRAANEAWALKVEESQGMADGLAKKASLFRLSRWPWVCLFPVAPRAKRTEVGLGGTHDPWRFI